MTYSIIFVWWSLVIILSNRYFLGLLIAINKSKKDNQYLYCHYSTLQSMAVYWFHLFGLYGQWLLMSVTLCQPVYVSMSVCVLSVYLYLHVYLAFSFYLFVCKSVYLCLCQLCLSLCQSISLCLSLCLSVWLCLYIYAQFFNPETMLPTLAGRFKSCR